MRVLHILGSADIGGIERLTAELIQVLHKEESNLSMGVLFSLSSGGAMSGLFEVAGMKMTSLGLTSGYDFSPRKYRMARALMRDFDVLHLHNFNPLVAAAAVSSGVPILYTEHGNFGFGRKPSLSDRIKQRMLRRFLNNKVRHVTFNSKFTRRTAIRRYGLSSVNQSVVYNGVILKRASPAEFVSKTLAQRLQGKFVVGTSSRFARFKRLDRLITAFAEFSRRRSEVVLLLVGDGELRSELEEQVSDLGLVDDVIFAGFRTEVTAYQELMDVCVFPSQNEPFGLVAIEAYALGKPVIVFEDGGGFLETVGEFNPDDVVPNEEVLASRLQHYYDNPGEIGAGSERRVKRAMEFDIKRMANEFVHLYESLA